MPDGIEPTNAVLATKIEEVNRRLAEQETEASGFRDEVRASIARVEALVRTEVDRVIERIHGLDLRAEANKTQIESVQQEAKRRMDEHEKWTQEQEKASRFRTGAIIAAVTAAATLAAVAVSIAVVLH